MSSIKKKPRLNVNKSDNRNEGNSRRSFAPNRNIENFFQDFTHEKILELMEELKPSSTRSAQKPNSSEKTSRRSRSTYVPPNPLQGIGRAELLAAEAAAFKAVEDLQRSSSKSHRNATATSSKTSVKNTARKELFKLPPNPKNTNKSRPSLVRRLSNAQIPIPTKKPKLEQPIDSSPLLNLTQNEDMILKSSAYPFRSPSTPVYKFTINLPPIHESDMSKTPESNIKTPQSNSDMSSSQEFCENERMCNINDSPISSVCDMLKNKMLLASQKKPRNKPLSTGFDVDDLSSVLKEQQLENERYTQTEKEIWEEFQRKSEENRTVHFQKLAELNAKLSAFSSQIESGDAEKENSNKRRSLRLLSKSPLKKNMSPVILKSGDLRKSALTKNLASKCEKYQLDSPRIKKAVDMYNSTRQVCSVLCTPKTDRKFLNGDSPNNSGNWRSALSRKVQNQCLMLQDTPKHA